MAITKRVRKMDGIAVFLIDFRDQDGERVRETAGTTRTQARKLLEQRIGEVRAGTYLNPRKEAKRQAAAVGPLFAEFVNTFKTEYGNLRRSRYYRQRLQPARTHFEGRRLKEITREDVDLYAAARSRERIGKKRQRPISPSKIRKDLIALGTLFKMARRWGVIVVSPVQDVTKPREPQHRTRWLTEEEWRALAAAAPPWLRPMLTVAVMTGARLKEVVGSRWEDVDRKAGLLYVTEDNKTATPRALPISDPVTTVLDERGKAVDLRTGKPLSAWVFADGAGKPYTSEQARDRVSKAAKAAMKAAGIHGATFKTLRHTAASWAVQDGWSLKQTGDLLGHKTPSMTQRYAHLQPGHLRGVTDSLAARALRVDTPVDTGTPGAQAAQSAGRDNLAAVSQLGR